MEITLPRVSLSLAVLLVIVCSVDAQNYLAFPRMGRSEVQKKPQLPWNYIVPRKRGLPQGFILPRKRGYLAFPRMGRSHFKSETSADVTGCCGVGIKSEFLIGQDGKEEIRSACGARADCCEGLKEVVDQKNDGFYFSMCVPDTTFAQASSVRSSEVFNKLKSLLEK